MNKKNKKTNDIKEKKGEYKGQELNDIQLESISGGLSSPNLTQIITHRPLDQAAQRQLSEQKFKEYIMNLGIIEQKKAA